MSNNRQKIVELESLRGLAALLVVFFHLPKWNPFLDVNLINNGYLMVELFFVISGFVIFNAYSKRINSLRDLINFQFLRIGRLYPIHLLFLTLFLIIELSKYLGVSKFGVENVRTIPFTKNSIDALIEQIFLLQAILPNGNATTFNPPAWSISVEFYTYIIFALTVLFFKKGKTWAMAIFCSASIFLLITGSTFSMDYLLRCLAGFFLGCLTAFWSGVTSFKPPKYASLLTFLSIGVFLQIKFPGDFDYLIFFLTAALIASLVLQPNGWLNSILTARIPAWLGEISYSIYMSQAFIVWGVSNFYKRILNLPEFQEANGSWSVRLLAFEAAAAAILTVIIILFASQLLHTWVEKPLRNSTRRLVHANRQIANRMNTIN